MTTWTIGIDLGGTNLRVAAFAELEAQAEAARVAGAATVVTPAASLRRAVGADRRVEAVIDAIVEVTGEVLAQAGVDGDADVAVGIGLAAMLADRRGTVARSPHLDWTDVAFGPALAARLGPHRRLGVYNDVNAVAYGEYGLGAGAGARDVLVAYGGPGLGKTRFEGVVFQKQNRGAGFFIGTDRSGAVEITPAP